MLSAKLVVFISLFSFAVRLYRKLKLYASIIKLTFTVLSTEDIFKTILLHSKSFGVQKLTFFFLFWLKKELPVAFVMKKAMHSF